MVQGGGEDESIGFSSTHYKKVDGLFSYISPRGGGISSYYSCAYIYIYIYLYLYNELNFLHPLAFAMRR